MATLSITKQYYVTLDSGKEFKLDSSSLVTNLGEVMEREVKVPTASEVTLILIGAAIAAGQLTDIKFFVIVNEDDTNTCRVRLEDTGGHTIDVLLQPGQSWDVYNTKINASETGAAFASFSDIDTISAQFDTADGIVSIMAGESC